jgi:hypothetical protein
MHSLPVGFASCFGVLKYCRNRNSNHKSQGLRFQHGCRFECSGRVEVSGFSVQVSGKKQSTDTRHLTPDPPPAEHLVSDT